MKNVSISAKTHMHLVNLPYIVDCMLEQQRAYMRRMQIRKLLVQPADIEKYARKCLKEFKIMLAKCDKPASYLKLENALDNALRVTGKRPAYMGPTSA